MIVVDASAVLAGLLHHGEARDLLAEESLHAPHLMDAEVASGVRRRAAAGDVTSEEGWRLLDTLRRLGMARYPVAPFLDRVWRLRDNLSAYDAIYVALAESLGCALVTADRRLAGAPGLRCAVTTVPR